METDLDLEKLFLPAWAQDKSAGNRYEKFTGNEGMKPERRFNDKPGARPGPRRDGGGGDRRGGPSRWSMILRVRGSRPMTFRYLEPAPNRNSWSGIPIFWWHLV